MVLNAQNINKFYNGKQVLNNVSLKVEDGDRIGLVGVNGCGKTTLLRILTAAEPPDKIAGVDTALVCEQKDIGYLAQSTCLNNSNSVFCEMKSVFSELLEAFERMRELEKHLQNPENAEEYSALSTYFETNDGYNIDVKIKTVLGGLGFSEADYERHVSSFSGGEQTRLAIAKLLLENPKLLILDEPTNHLDFKTVTWLEEYLKTYKGALLIVSHDRYFLDRLCGFICEIERGKIVRYKGNYTAFVKQKEERVTREIKEYERQQDEIAKLEDYVSRNISRESTAKSAQSRVKQLERMELVDRPVTHIKDAVMSFSYNIEPPLEVLQVKDIDICAGEKKLLENVNLEVRRGDKLAIIGENGAGKSTLLKVLCKKSPLNCGRLRWADNVKISYYEQENTALNPRHSVFEEIHSRFPLMSDLDIRSTLAKVRVIGEDVFKKVGVISGGERAKVRFAVMLLEKGNVLILDEPTNHLDLATKEVLEKALQDFTGTLVMVSHDRYFLDKIPARIVEIERGVLNEYNGNFTEYQRLKKHAAAVDTLGKKAEKAVDNAKADTQNSYNKGKDQRKSEAQKRARIKFLETRIDELERLIKALETEITLPEICSDFVVLGEKCARIENSKLELDAHIEELIGLD